MKTLTLTMIAVLGLAAVCAAAADKKAPPSAPWPPPNTVVVTGSPEKTTTVAIRGKPPTGRLQKLDQTGKQLRQQVQTLSASVAQSGWNGTQRTNGTASIRTGIDDLAREMSALQASNGGANYSTGLKLAGDLQQDLAQITAAEKALGAARDAPGASAALTKMSVSLDKMIMTIDTLPPCCTEGICCHVGIQ